MHQACMVGTMVALAEVVSPWGQQKSGGELSDDGESRWEV